mgnify:CR=1 FL=1
MKKIALLLLLIVTSLLTANADSVYDEYFAPRDVVVYSKSSRNINAIDPSAATAKKNTYYPGYRGANQLVIYTSAYGTKTNTNEFGAEAIVKDNTVVALSGADSLIPNGGIVISGHGSAKTWINKNIIVGTKIYINPETNTITAYTTSESYIYGAKECLKEVRDVMSYYINEDDTYNKKSIEDRIKSAENCIKKAEHNPAQVREYSELAIEYANKALSMSVPYKDSELKGVWLRPEVKTKEDIVYIVSKLADAGINNIFLETYYHGMTIFPSKTMVKYGFIEKNPTFGDLDVLKTFIDEAHKRKMKVNIWFETFYVGNKRPESNKKSILAVNPTWTNLTKATYDSEKPVTCSAEHNGYFLDPANPEVQIFLLQLICEIIYRYQPDGINMDYIRYPQSSIPRVAGSEQSAWGYTCFAREDFKSIYGIDPICLNPTDSCWQAWNDYRRGKVTEFVRRVSKICRSNKVNLTAVIFPSVYSALENKHQDWTVWTANDYIDGFTPLFLTCDPVTASDMMKGVVRYKNTKTKLYAGLFTAFMNGSQMDMVRQIHEARKLKIDGFSIFDYAHLQDKYITTLKESITTAPPQQSVNKRKRSKIFRKKEHVAETTTNATDNLANQKLTKAQLKAQKTREKAEKKAEKRKLKIEQQKLKADKKLEDKIRKKDEKAEKARLKCEYKQQMKQEKLKLKEEKARIKAELKEEKKALNEQIKKEKQRQK